MSVRNSSSFATYYESSQSGNSFQDLSSTPEDSDWQVVSHSRGRHRTRSSPAHSSLQTEITGPPAPPTQENSLTKRVDNAASGAISLVKKSALFPKKGSYSHKNSLPASLRYLSLTDEEPLTFFSAHQTTHNDPHHMLCNAIRQAKNIITMKIFNISSPEIVKALIQAAHHGTGVFVSAQNCQNLETLDPHSKLNITIGTIAGASLHKKTTLIDKSITILGTANYTRSSFSKDINLTALIRNPNLCSLISNSTHGTISIGNQTISYYPLPFPQPNSKPLPIIQELLKARHSIKIAMNIFSHSELIQTLEYIRLQGVAVSIIINKKESPQASNALQKVSAQLPLQIVSKTNFLHAKICLIDNQTLLFGSPNWTYHGMHENLEDLLIISPLTPKQLHAIQEIWSWLSQNSTFL